MANRAKREWHFQRGDLRAATHARHEFARYIDSKHAGAKEAYDATLIFGELVANALRSARSAVCVELIEGEWTSLRVIDDGDCFERAPESTLPATDSQDGRGLYLVTKLARNLDVAVGEHHCQVTAVLPVRS
jgi:anti-sigma regulatory factor (Ser/Thr protein kinase)